MDVEFQNIGFNSIKIPYKVNEGGWRRKNREEIILHNISRRQINSKQNGNLLRIQKKRLKLKKIKKNKTLVLKILNSAAHLVRAQLSYTMTLKTE